MHLLVKRLDERAKLPFRATADSVGLDLHAFLLTDSGRFNTALIPPKTTRLIRTGLAVEPPTGYAVFICSRSGLAKDASLFVTNAPGVIDPDYRGELCVLLYNGGFESYYVKHEDRIGQMILLPIAQNLEVAETTQLSASARGENGFGSSGR